MIPIYRCYLQSVGAGRPRLWAGITTGPCPALVPVSSTNTSRHIQNKEAESDQNRLVLHGCPASAHARLMTVITASQTGYRYFVLRRWIMSNLVSFAWIIDWKDKRVDLFTHNIDVLGSCCYVLCNSEHWTYFQGTCIRLYLLEFCSFPTEHMMIITVLLQLFGIYCCVLV